ncbi:MAG: CBS domain-containing protein [Candidatus Hodarchaeota archaeon]
MRKMVRVAALTIDDEYDTIEGSRTVLDAAKKMKEVGIPDLVVMEGEKVLGIVTDYDITTRIVAEEKDPKTTSVTEAMYTIPTVTLRTSVEEALRILQEYSAPIVPVLHADKLKGVVSVQDCWSVIPENKWIQFERKSDEI